LHGLLETALVVVVVANAVGGGEQILEKLRLVPAKLVEPRICGGLLS
jgi:hypothetical protein